MTEKEKEEALRIIKQLHGCMKGKAKMSDREARKRAFEKLSKKWALESD